MKNQNINQIIAWAVANRFLVITTLIAVLSAAFFAIPKLNLDAFPDVTNVQVTINTEAPGLASEEVEQLITFPIESVMYALPDVEEVRSISKTGLSGITVVFKEGTDIYFARQLVFERLQSAKEIIPAGLGMPELGPNTSGLGQIYQYLLIADTNSGYDITSLRSLNDWVVKLLLMPIDGITDVLSFGGQVKQYQVNINPSRLLAYALTQEDVVTAIEHSNTNVGGWYMNRGQEQLVIRGMGWIKPDQQGLKEISQTPLKTVDGAVITVADVATVNFGSEIRQGAVTMTRRSEDNDISVLGEVVSGIVLKRIGVNTKSTIDGINERVTLIRQALPKGITFEPFYDQGQLITASVNTVIHALVLAFVFIVIVLALFLMNLRATLLVLISIPISIGMALMLMSWFGLSANLMSLGGLAVAIGMLVDGSVVMVENIFKHLSQHQSESHQKLSNIERIKVAGQEVAKSTLFATLIILVVFAPMFTFEGVEAKLFQPMAISIMLAIISALVVALVVVPAAACLLFKTRPILRKSAVLTPINYAYKKSLSAAIKAPKVILTMASLLLIAAIVLFQQLGSEFIPELEEGTINLRVTLAPSSSLNTALDIAPKLEAILMKFPEVEYALSRIGRPEIGGDPEPVNNIEIYIGLKPLHQWRNATSRIALQNLMAKELEQFPGLLLNFSQPIATRVDELLSGVKAQLSIKLFGAELDVLAEKGKEIEYLVQQVEGTRDVALEQISGEAQLVITPNRRQLSRYGLSVEDVMSVVRDGIGGQSAGQVIKGNERYDIYVRLSQQFRKNQAAIVELRLQSPNGAWVRMGDVADISIASGPPQIRRDDVQRRVVIQANVQGRDMGSIVEDIRKSIHNNVDLPTGYSVSFGGQFESQQRAQKRLAIVVPLSLVLIAGLLYLAFGSFKQVALILVNIPLAAIGGIFALYISNQYLSVPSAVGFITLFGVAVLNGIVMVESINQRIASGLRLQQAIFDGALSRLRPVLMTAMTSALGLIPILLSNGAGAEIQKPLATVVIGGLFSATLLTLYVLPILYPTFTHHSLKAR